MYLPNKKRPWLPWLAGFLLIAFLVAFFHCLGGILTPFIIAAVLAYILNPLVGKLEAHGIKRGRASMWVMLFALFLLTALLLVIVPMLVQQSQSIIQKLPQFADYIHRTALPWFNQKFGHYLSLNNETAANWLRSNAQTIQTRIQQALPALMQSGASLATSLSNIVLLPLLLYYFLLDWARWEAGATELVPRRYLDTYTRITGNMNTVLGFAIGMVAGILVFVPYLGAFTGLLLATLAALLQFGSWHGLVSVWAVFAVGQFLESFLITPKIVGDKIGLSPFWVIFSLMAFGQLLGFVGMLVALPLAAVCLVLLQEGKQAYVSSSFYRKR